MTNPYLPPQATVDPPADTSFRWRRILAWAVLIYAAGSLVGLLSGFTMARWEVYGSTFDAAVANSRLVRRVVYGVVGAVLYWQFAAPLDSRRLLHVAALFCALLLLDAVLALIIFQVAAADLVNLSSWGRSLLAAVVGGGLAHFASSRKTVGAARDA